MQTKNKFAISREILYGMMMVGLFLSGFGNTDIAYSRGTTVEPPPYEEIEKLLEEDMLSFGETIPKGMHIKVDHTDVSDDWMIIAYFFDDEDGGLKSGELGIGKNETGEWVIISDANPKFNEWLVSIPTELLHEDAKSHFMIPEPSDVSATNTYTGHRLPWQGGISHYVSSGVGGHSHPYEYWAYDFAMSRNTEVWASYSGTVVHVTQGYGPGSCDPNLANYGNRVVINNDDGSASLYLHLEQNGARVSNGQRVNRGDLVALSGNSGYVCSSTGGDGAHLHFQVQAQGSSWWTQSHQVIFDPNGEPAAGTSPISGNYRYSEECPTVSGEVRLYDSTNCGGDYVTANNTGLWYLVPNFNDQAESIAIPSGWSARLYLHDSESSPSACFGGTDTDLWNNTFSDGTTVANQATWMRVYNNSSCTGASYPDLVIQSITASPTNPSINQSVTFTVRVKNQGTGDATSSFYVDLFADAQPDSCPTDGNITYWTVSSLAAGATQDLTYTYSGFSTGGTHNLYAIADSYCFISESNDGNNTLGPVAVNVQNPQPPPAPTLSSPGNSSSNPYNYDLTFQWNSSSGATEYLVEWWGGPYTTMQPCGWSSSTSCHIGTVAAGNTYSWHVKARNSAGESGWSNTWTFTIQSAGTGLDCGQVSYNGVILYENKTCNKYIGGVTKAFSSPTGWIDIVSDPINDKASSIYVGNGWSIKVFEHPVGQGGGSWHCINGSMWDLGVDHYTNGNTNQIIEDTISSIQVYNNGSCTLAAPSLISPGNGSSNPYNYDLTFQWNSSSGATEYLVEWWGGPYTTMQPCGWSSSTSCHIGTIAPGNTYSWHVKARNGSGESGWSSTWSFTIQPSPPGSFNKSSPTNGATGQSINPSLSWGASSGATSYQYCIATSIVLCYNQLVAKSFSTSNTSVTVSNLASNTTYYWHVMAYNADGAYTYSNGSSSEFWSFTTQAAVSPVNILFNGGFEDGSSNPTWWSIDAWTPSYSTFTWDTSQKHSGNKSVKISSNPANDARWIQTVFVQPNSDYRLSGWIKTENVEINGDRGANISILDTFTGTASLKGTNDWTYVSINFNTETRTSIRVAARLGQYSGEIGGTAWFDDLKLELLSAPTCYSLTKTVSPSGRGSIITNPAPNCNGTQYVHGTVVALTAVPNSGYTFSNWSGNSDSTGFVIMTGNKSVTANFIPEIDTSIAHSVGANDGWILESTETSTTGGTMNNTATTLLLGDDASDRQYRAILHFDTSTLPDNAVVTSATLQMRKQSTSGTNPFTILGSLRVDARRPDFGLPTLELTDFRASAAKNNIATFDPAPAGSWYSAVFNSTGRLYINRTGTTQFKIYFTTGDNDDLGADLIKFYSGNARASLRPKLVIQYYVP